ncbi:hypothetical protein F4677DRAFT_463626 [Hypoxylon crocopeplum]|nr:hypothetical protein F4677DRAFT_463626 [Hypoxylon crocopeplum]
MNKHIETNKMAFFRPSYQLLGVPRKQGESEQRPQYLGDLNHPDNTSQWVPAHRNTNVWVRGFSSSVPCRDFLNALQNIGKVRALVVHPADKEHESAAASISFFRRDAAVLLINLINTGIITVHGNTLSAIWNRNRVAETDEGWNSRVLLIAGNVEVVNPTYLERFFRSKFVYDIDRVIDHGVVPGPGGPIARLEYRFACWRGQAVLAKIALQREHGGQLLVDYGMDPCA